MDRLLLFVCAACLTGGTFAADRAPNIVFIMADDLGWRDVGFAGAEFFETPHVDRLASQGMTFTAGYSGGPNCSPTRACLMSGTYTPRHQIYTPSGSSKGNPHFMRLLVPARDRKNARLNQQAEQFRITNSLASSFVCIPEILSQAGYQTARLGKWHLGEDTQGFHLSSANGRGGPGGRFYKDIDVAERITDRALEFIEKNREKPFFLYLTHWDVHTPWLARQEVVERFAKQLAEIPAGQHKNFNPVYAAMISAVDTSVGRVTAKIDELGLSEDTLIIFTSDNGGLHRVSQLSPLRGEKGSLFEAGVRVPLCMRWPGTIEAGSTCETPVTSVDYLPTFTRLAAAGLPTGQPVDGTDVSPLMRGESIPERGIFWHYPLYLTGRGLTIDLPDEKTYSWRGFPSSSVRRGDWKLIEFHEDSSIGLYNLREDPGETQNLAQVHSDRANAMRAELDSWQKATKAPIPSVANPECILPSVESVADSGSR